MSCTQPDVCNSRTGTDRDLSRQLLEALDKLDGLRDDLSSIGRGQRRLEELLEGLCASTPLWPLVGTGPKSASESELEYDHENGREGGEEGGRANSKAPWQGVTAASLKVPHFRCPRSSENIASSRDSTALLAPTLPPTWPVSIQKRDGLDSETTVTDTKERWAVSGKQIACRNPAHHAAKSFVGAFYGLPISPNSTFHLFCDLCSVMILVVDLTLIPVILAWNVTLDGGLKLFAQFTTLFWSWDVVLNFLTGFHRDGELEMRIWPIMKNYLTTWFGLDFTIVLCDLVSMVLMEVMDEEGTAGLKLLRFAKMSRLIRVFGLLRMFRLARISEEFLDRYGTEGLRMFFRVVSMFATVLWLNHVIGCSWYAFGRGLFQSDTGNTWMDAVYYVRDDRVEFAYGDLNLKYLYVTSLHWAMAQMTLGAIEIVCLNTAERIGNIAMLFLGLLFSATLVSSLSATMIGLEMRSKEVNECLASLRLFLHQNRVETSLALRIKQQAEHRIRKDAKLTVKDVKILHILSSSLRAELHYDLFSPHLSSHSLFRLWSHLSVPLLQDLCVEYVHFKFLDRDDDLFVAGGSCDTAYFFVKGHLTYMQAPATSAVKSVMESTLSEGTWFCEAGLWTKWTHVGTMMAESTCQLMALHADGVLSLINKHRLIQEITLEYAQQFLRCVHSARPPTAAWPTDVTIPFTEFGDILLSMKPAGQVAVGLISLENAQKSLLAKLSHENYEELKQEVLAHKSTLLLNSAEHLERVAAVTTLRVRRSDGRLFLQLGKLDGSRVVASCQLPGAKPEADETPAETARRILNTKLTPLAECVELEECSREVQWRESKKYRMRTKYIRTVCNAMVVMPFSIPGYRAATRVNSGGWYHIVSVASASTLCKRDVFIIQSDPENAEKVSMFVWATEEEFSMLQRPESEQFLSTWLQSLVGESAEIIEQSELHSVQLHEVMLELTRVAGRDERSVITANSSNLAQVTDDDEARIHSYPSIVDLS